MRILIFHLMSFLFYHFLPFYNPPKIKSAFRCRFHDNTYNNSLQETLIFTKATLRSKVDLLYKYPFGLLLPSIISTVWFAQASLALPNTSRRDIQDHFYVVSAASNGRRKT